MIVISHKCRDFTANKLYVMQSVRDSVAITNNYAELTDDKLWFRGKNKCHDDSIFNQKKISLIF